MVKRGAKAVSCRELPRVGRISWVPRVGRICLHPEASKTARAVHKKKAVRDGSQVEDRDHIRRQGN